MIASKCSARSSRSLWRPAAEFILLRRVWAASIGVLLGSVHAASFDSAQAFAADPPITSIVVAESGEVLVGSQSGIEIVEWPSRAVLRRVNTRLENVERMRFNVSGDRLFAVGGIPGEEGMIEIWSWPELELLERDTLHDDIITDISPAGDLNEFATSSMDSYAAVHRDRSAMLSGHSKSVLSVAWLSDAITIVSAGRDRSIRVWNAETHELIRTLNNHTGEVRALQERPPDGEQSNALPMVASAGADRTIRLWQPTIGRLVRFTRLPASALDIAWSIDGNHLYAACEDGFVRLINADSVDVVGEFDTDQPWLYAIGLDKQRGGVFVGGGEGRLEFVPREELLASEQKSNSQTR